MKKLLYIGLLKLKLLIKDKAAFRSVILAPLIFIAVLVIGFGHSDGSGSAPKYPVGVVNNDTGKYSKLLINMMKNDKYFDVVENNLEKSKEDVKNGKVTMSFVIPKDFSSSIENGEAKDIDIIKLQDNENTSSFGIIVNNYVYQLSIGNNAKKISSNMLTSMNLATASSKSVIEENIEKDYLNSLKSPKNTYSIKALQKDGSHAKDNLSTAAMGIIIMFIMFFVTLGAGSILEEKEFGTWNRTLSTPTRNQTIIGGYIFGNFIIGWIQVAVLILAGKYLFNLNFGNSLFGIILLFSSFLLAAIGLGTVLSFFVKSKAQLKTLAPIIVVPTCLLAGCMWPREIMPETMIKLSNFLPQTWAIKGMTDLITRNSGISSVYTPSLVLITFAIVFFIASAGVKSFQRD